MIKTSFCAASTFAFFPELANIETPTFDCCVISDQHILNIAQCLTQREITPGQFQVLCVPDDDPWAVQVGPGKTITINTYLLKTLALLLHNRVCDPDLTQTLYTCGEKSSSLLFHLVAIVRCAINNLNLEVSHKKPRKIYLHHISFIKKK